MIRTYDEAMWDAHLTSTVRLRWTERRSRRAAAAGKLDAHGHTRWAATLAVLKARDEGLR